MNNESKTRKQLVAEARQRREKGYKKFLADEAEIADELTAIHTKFDNMTEEDFAEYMKELDRESEELNRQWEEDTKKALSEGRSIGMIDSPKHGVLGYLKQKNIIK